MTGYGSAEETHESGVSVSVEISSVNRKNLDIKINLPDELLRMEIPLRKLLSSKISRGSLVMRISRKIALAGENSSQPNTMALEDSWKKLNALRVKLGIKTELTISDILLFPEALTENSETMLGLDELVLSVVSKALDKLIGMRGLEGQALHNDVLEKIRTLSKILAEIEPRCNNTAIQRRDILFSRLNAMQIPLDINDERIVKEIAIFAEKCDVSEEITRIKSHLTQFVELSKSAEPIGKNLDFIAQELQREIGTLSAKNQNSDLTFFLISFKSEVEKIREQIQNIE
jgi:uncharacterized protein (TIGR00255 family)